jgi:hypothetical protein
MTDMALLNARVTSDGQRGREDKKGERERETRTVLVCPTELDHITRQDLRDAADLGGNDEQPRRGRFDDADPERLGEGRVEVDVSAHQHLRVSIRSTRPER